MKVIKVMKVMKVMKMMKVRKTEKKSRKNQKINLSFNNRGILSFVTRVGSRSRGNKVSRYMRKTRKTLNHNSFFLQNMNFSRFFTIAKKTKAFLSQRRFH